MVENPKEAVKVRENARIVRDNHHGDYQSGGDYS